MQKINVQLNIELPIGESSSTYSHGVLSSMASCRDVVPGTVPSVVSTSGAGEVADGDDVCSVGGSSDGVLLTSASAGDASFFFHARFFGGYLYSGRLVMVEWTSLRSS
jgi:hypothetical protein